MLAHELLDHALQLLLAKDMAGFANLWAPDGVAEFPFAPPGYPTRLEGREAVADYMRGYPGLLDIHEIPERTVHRTLDPAVVVAEFTAVGTVVATGAPYRFDYVAVITVADGMIRHYRDYWNPLAVATAMGGFDAPAELTGGAHD